jgi:hypothetical protein
VQDVTFVVAKCTAVFVCFRGSALAQLGAVLVRKVQSNTLTKQRRPQMQREGTDLEVELAVCLEPLAG